MIKPTDLMTLAERLATVGAETEGRSTISRAYYSAFHEARLLLEDGCGVRFQKSDAGIHRKICNCLDESKSSELRSIAERLDTFRAERNRADYDLAESRFAKQSNVQAQITIAKKIIEQINAASAKIAEFRPAVRQYASEVLKLGLR